MIRVRFFSSGETITGFSVCGHAGYAPYGEDIVCASVSSAVQLTVNAITEILKLPAEVSAEGEEVMLMLSSQADAKNAQPFFKALHLHLELLSQDFEKTILFVD